MRKLKLTKSIKQGMSQRMIDNIINANRMLIDKFGLQKTNVEKLKYDFYIFECESYNLMVDLHNCNEELEEKLLERFGYEIFNTFNSLKNSSRFWKYLEKYNFHFINKDLLLIYEIKDRTKFCLFNPSIKKELS